MVKVNIRITDRVIVNSREKSGCWSVALPVARIRAKACSSPTFTLG